MKKAILTAIFAVAIISVQAQVFEESMGKVTENTSIDAHNSAKGFKNSDKLIFSGSANVQNIGGATASNTYQTLFGVASGGANVRISDAPGSDFVISGINTTGVESPVLGFGILKGTKKSNGSDLVLEYKIDGQKWKTLNFPPMPTGEGSDLVWMYRISSAPLPQAENLSIRFRQTGGGCVFRIDDVCVASKKE